MRYKREAELVFDLSPPPPQRQQKQHPTQPTLRYIADAPCPPEKQFFLDHIRAHLLSIPELAQSPRRLLAAVAGAWDQACAVSEQIRRLNLSFPTTTTTTTAPTAAGGGVSVVASVLLVPLQTRVEVVLGLEASGADVVVAPGARVVYGEGFNPGKMREFLAGRVGGAAVGRMGWDEAVLGLHGMLLAKGKRRVGGE